MSTLQCPATLLLAVPGVEVPSGLRVAQEWAPDEGLRSHALPVLREALAAIADQAPGETTLVPLLDDRLRAALPRLARVDVDPDQLRDADVLALEIDADDWVVRTVRA